MGSLGSPPEPPLSARWERPPCIWTSYLPRPGVLWSGNHSREEDLMAYRTTASGLLFPGLAALLLAGSAGAGDGIIEINQA